MFFKLLKAHLQDNGGMTDIARLIIMAATFVAGALLIYSVTEIINETYPAGTEGKINDILD